MQKKIKGLLGNEYVRGGVFITLSFTLANVCNLVYTIFTGRQLGPVGYGEITALLSYISIASVPVSVIITIVTQKVSEADENAGETATQIEQFFWKTLRRWWFVIILLFLVTPFIPALTNLSPVTSQFLLPVLLATFLFLLYGSFVQGMRLFVLYSIITVISPVIKLLGPFVSKFTGHDLFTVLFFLFLSFFLPFIYIYRSFHHTIKHHKANTKAIEKSLVHIIKDRQFIITTLSILGATLLNNLDVIFVKKFFTDHDAGIYGSWSLLAKIIFYLIGPISSVSFVFFSSKKQATNHNRTLIFSVMVLLLVGMASYIFYTFFANTVITTLFGAKYFAVLPYLGMASIFGSLYSLLNYVNNYFLARKSNAALIMPIMMVVYVVFLYAINKTLQNIMLVNIGISAVILVMYAVYFALNYKKS